MRIGNFLSKDKPYVTEWTPHFALFPCRVGLNEVVVFEWVWRRTDFNYNKQGVFFHRQKWEYKKAEDVFFFKENRDCVESVKSIARSARTFLTRGEMVLDILEAKKDLHSTYGRQVALFAKIENDTFKKREVIKVTFSAWVGPTIYEARFVELFPVFIGSQFVESSWFTPDK